MSAPVKAARVVEEKLCRQKETLPLEEGEDTPFDAAEAEAAAAGAAPPTNV